MAFDPTKPVENSPLDAVEIRNQFNALKALIDGLQQQLAPMVPVLTRSAAGQWTVTYAGSVPSCWHIFARCSSNPDWTDTGEMNNSDFPAPDADVVPDNVTWWQIKLCGADGDDNLCTPFSNIISSGPVPA